MIPDVSAWKMACKHSMTSDFDLSFGMRVLRGSRSALHVRCAFGTIFFETVGRLLEGVGQLRQLRDAIVPVALEGFGFAHRRLQIGLAQVLARLRELR